MADLTLILVIVGVALIALDLFLPTGGFLAGAGIALLLERGLAHLGVIPWVRVPLAAAGMFVTVALAMRFGERISDNLAPPRIRTGIERLVGQTVRVRRVEEEGVVVEVEGDLWTAQLAAGEPSPRVGERLVVVAFTGQELVVGRAA